MDAIYDNVAGLDVHHKTIKGKKEQQQALEGRFTGSCSTGRQA